jgi:hypothetical protein
MINNTKINPISDTTKELLLKEKKNYIMSRSAKLQPGVVEKIIQELTETAKLPDKEQALVIIAMLFQQGGTARSCDGNMVVSLFGATVKLADLRKILKNNQCNRAERKLARSLANQIQEICEIMDIPGNLYKKIQKSHLDREFIPEERSWLSDFQSDNEKCPTELKKYILETFKPKNEPKKGKKK